MKTTFQRYMRLTPSVAFIILCNRSLGLYLSKHAPPAFLDYSVRPCEKFWWSSLLHIQVYTNPQAMVRFSRNLMKALSFHLSFSVHAHNMVSLCGLADDHLCCPNFDLSSLEAWRMRCSMVTTAYPRVVSLCFQIRIRWEVHCPRAWFVSLTLHPTGG